MEEFTSAERFWLKAFPRGAMLIGGSVVGLALAIGGGRVAEKCIHAYQYVKIAEIKAGIVQSIVDGAVTIVQTVVAGVTG
jgi:hypothetical protein